MQHNQVHPLLLVAGGAIVGSAVRYGALETVGAGWWVVLILNVAGSVLVGWMLGQRLDRADDIWLAGSVGFCGGLTTFSGFALQVAERLDESQWLSAGLVALSTVLLAVIGAGVGYRAAKR